MINDQVEEENLISEDDNIYEPSPVELRNFSNVFTNSSNDLSSKKQTVNENKGEAYSGNETENECENSGKAIQRFRDDLVTLKINSDVEEIRAIVRTIIEAVFHIVDNNFHRSSSNRSSNILGMRVKDSLILKAQQNQRKGTPFDGLRTSIACHLVVDDDKLPFLPRTKSPTSSSAESESLSRKRKKSVSLAENVKILNPAENEFLVENQVGVSNVTNEEKSDEQTGPRNFTSSSGGSESFSFEKRNSIRDQGKVASFIVTEIKKPANKIEENILIKTNEKKIKMKKITSEEKNLIPTFDETKNVLDEKKNVGTSEDANQRKFLFHTKDDESGESKQEAIEKEKETWSKRSKTTNKNSDKFESNVNGSEIEQLGSAAGEKKPQDHKFVFLSDPRVDHKSREDVKLTAKCNVGAESGAVKETNVSENLKEKSDKTSKSSLSLDPDVSDITEKYIQNDGSKQKLFPSELKSSVNKINKNIVYPDENIVDRLSIIKRSKDRDRSRETESVDISSKKSLITNPVLLKIDVETELIEKQSANKENLQRSRSDELKNSKAGIVANTNWINNSETSEKSNVVLPAEKIDTLENDQSSKKSWSKVSLKGSKLLKKLSKTDRNDDQRLTNDRSSSKKSLLKLFRRASNSSGKLPYTDNYGPIISDQNSPVETFQKFPNDTNLRKPMKTFEETDTGETENEVEFGEEFQVQTKSSKEYSDEIKEIDENGIEKICSLFTVYGKKSLTDLKRGGESPKNEREDPVNISPKISEARESIGRKKSMLNVVSKSSLKKENLIRNSNRQIMSMDTEDREDRSNESDDTKKNKNLIEGFKDSLKSKGNNSKRSIDKKGFKLNDSAKSQTEMGQESLANFRDENDNENAMKSSQSLDPKFKETLTMSKEENLIQDENEIENKSEKRSRSFREFFKRSAEKKGTEVEEKISSEVNNIFEKQSTEVEQENIVELYSISTDSDLKQNYSSLLKISEKGKSEEEKIEKRSKNSQDEIKMNKSNSIKNEETAVKKSESIKAIIQKPESMVAAYLAETLLEDQPMKYATAEERTESDSSLEFGNEINEEESRATTIRDKEKHSILSNLKSVFRSSKKPKSQKDSAVGIEDPEKNNSEEIQINNETNNHSMVANVPSTKSLDEDRKRWDNRRKPPGHKLLDEEFNSVQEIERKDDYDVRNISVKQGAKRSKPSLKKGREKEEVIDREQSSRINSPQNEKVEAKSVENDDKNREIDVLKDCDGEKRIQDKRIDGNGKKFASSLSRIFGNSFKKRKASDELGPRISSQTNPEDHFQVTKIPLASSDDSSCSDRIEKEKFDAVELDNREELVAIKSLGSVNDSRNYNLEKESSMKKKISNVTNRTTPEIEESDIDKVSLREEKTFAAKGTIVWYAPLVESAKYISKEGDDRCDFENNLEPEKLGKKLTDKSFSTIRKLFSKSSIKSRQDRTADNGSDKDSLKSGKSVTSKISSRTKGVDNEDNDEERESDKKVNKQRSRSKVEINTENYSDDPNFAVNKFETEHGGQKPSEIKQTGDPAGFNDEKNGRESSADSMTLSVQGSPKVCRKKIVSETHSIFSKTIKKLFKKRGSAVNSVTSNNTTDDLGRFSGLRSPSDVSNNKNFIDAMEETETPESMQTKMKEKDETERSAAHKDDPTIKTSSRYTESFFLLQNRSDVLIQNDNLVENDSEPATRNLNSNPFGRRKATVVMMATPDPPRKELQIEESSSSNHPQSSSACSTSAFYYLLGPSLDEALVDVRVVFQNLIDKITGRNK